MARTKITTWGTFEKRDRAFALWLGGRHGLAPDEVIERAQRCVSSGYIRIAGERGRNYVTHWAEPKAKSAKEIADELRCTQATVKSLIAFSPPAPPLTLPEVGNIERELADAEHAFGDIE